MKRFVPVLCAGALLLSAAACAPKEDPAASSQQPGASTSQSAPTGSQSAPDASASQPKLMTYSLFIGMDGEFKEYPMPYNGELNEQGQIPAEVMLAAMAELTGWDLTAEVTSGEDGMTVSFAEESAIFTGPPEEQKEEFHVYDAAQLTATILDSIQHTLQQNFVDVKQGGDPSALNIYFTNADQGDIVVPGLELTIPAAEPYAGLPAAPAEA